VKKPEFGQWSDYRNVVWLGDSKQPRAGVGSEDRKKVLR
jgi:hypothetical protein